MVTGAMVLGNEVLLGAIPMEDMDLVLRPQLQSWCKPAGSSSGSGPGVGAVGSGMANPPCC